MNRTLNAFRIPALLALVLTGTAFLLKMCYMPFWQCTLLGAAWLAAVYFYARLFHGVSMPPMLLVLVFAAVEVDALGNLFRMYGQRFGPVMYDEFAHMAVQALVAPLCVWLLGAALARLGYRPPLGVLVFFAVTTIFSLSAFYEIVEMWDERYFGGQRIWSTHDAPNDLQWDFLGILLGAAVAYFFLRREPGVRLQERSA
ncbi:MAG TPA: hypothetical protein VK421_15945 [Pyrinomonadaceae bacterium]|nr:hypothetical protein [Pyrinomonadaceae bacterium]